MDYDDLMKISEANLRKVVPKMGPGNKILEARKKLNSQNQRPGTSKAQNHNYYYESDEEKENVSEVSVGFITF